MRPLEIAALLLTATAAGSVAAAQDVASSDRPFLYQPDLEPPAAVTRFLDRLQPGPDTPGEVTARELDVRLEELAGRLRESPRRIAEVADLLLAPGFAGGIRSATASGEEERPLRVARAAAPEAPPRLAAPAFVSGLSALLEGFQEVDTAEFLITRIQPGPTGDDARTEVRYDLVGPGRSAWRVQSTGLWRMGWRRGEDGWRVEDWTVVERARSSAASPIFAEVTAAALGGDEAWSRQLTIGLDAWNSSIDSSLTRDSNAHHGVSVGDADGDGLEDLYVAQPAGLPNRLFLARPDGRFEDATERSGLGILDDTAQSLFADLDDDGDQDLLLSTATGPGLFRNDGSGRFVHVAGAFDFREPLQGTPMSITLADYDRDGLLDLYLCVYSFYYGAGEDKAGTPTPYYDARNGPPNVLLRNEGGTRFRDVTQESGLDAGNDRYSFSAAWADYDQDGWPDLLVANDFGRNNLYRNLGRVEGGVRFEDVTERAGVEDHAAGMSATWLDYDNDGLLDIYTGNMWSHNGLRITSADAFMPDAPEAVRALYVRHARGNSLFRNLGDGTFADVTLGARAEMGRWAWCSDALDFDSDGWEDLYAVNGMLSRKGSDDDLDEFFWREVVARSPATRVTGSRYDDAWRAINQLLIRGSIASHQRNVLLRNDGRGGFDDVSGAAGLDLDQDGRSFAALDLDRDGDTDLALMAARGAPQLRLFRNDYPERGATLALRLVGGGRAGDPGPGPKSNRDAIGARVTLETDVLSRTKLVRAGSGFLSQQSKELLFGLGPSRRVVRLTVDWPSGRRQVLSDVPLERRLRLEEGGELRAEPFATAAELRPDAAAPTPGRPPRDVWLYVPFPAPDFTLPDLAGEPRSLRALAGAPALVLLWTTEAAAARAAFEALAEGRDALVEAGVTPLALALDPPEADQRVREAAAGSGSLPVVHATPDAGRAFAILNRHLFMNRQDLLLPTALLLDAEGRVVKAYRGSVDVARVARDAAVIDAPPRQRLARALPFPGELHSPPAGRNYLPYGRELLDQGLEEAALQAFEWVARGDPSPSNLYQLGTLLVKSGADERARAAFERVLAVDPEHAEASNDLGALLAQGGDLAGAIARFRAALDANPEYPDALNNLGYALLLTGQPQRARELYERALELQPDFPEALNNLGLILGQEGDLAAAEPYFRRALEEQDDYGEAANNLALVLVRRGEVEAATRLLEEFRERNPSYEGTYVTLARIYLSTGQDRAGLRVLEQLLLRNPDNALAKEMLSQFR